ncbi:MAG TPA: hypothetical protein VHK01_05370 [Lacipirellulaceae bacterium]|nr:hypothetical protein [Lacipirellulaceae bacterium]
MAVFMVAVPCAGPGQEAHGPRETGRIRVRNLGEVSGLAVSRQNPDVIWLHNDGDEKQVFAVTTAGQLVARVRIDVPMTDVEDIAIGPGTEQGVDYLYVGDIGDNESSRQEIRVVRFAEPVLQAARNMKLDANGVEEFRLRYPDGPHDAEALLVDPTTGDVFIVVKEENRSRLYRVGADRLNTGAPIALELVGYLNVDDVSAGDISPDGDLIILRDEDRGWIWSRPGGTSVADSFKRAPRPVLVRAAGQAQNGEAVGFTPDGNSYYTVSEGDQEAIVIFPVPVGVVRRGG